MASELRDALRSRAPLRRENAMAPPREEHDAGGPASDHEVRARMVALAQERDALALMRDALKAELAARTRELEAN